jgi:hypothetical protein
MVSYGSPVSEVSQRNPALLRVDIGIVVWASFLAACLATMVFFAFFDPLLLAHDTSPPRWLSDRMTGYTVGFFFFWIICGVASGFTAWLIDTRTSDPVRDS